MTEIAITDEVRRAYLSLNMVCPQDKAAVLSGDWDEVHGMQVLARLYLEGRVAGRKEIIARGCVHTQKAAAQDGDGDRPDIRAWQEAQSQWFDATICEIVSEYAEWRDAQDGPASIARLWETVAAQLDKIPGGMNADLEDAASALDTALAVQERPDA